MNNRDLLPTVQEAGSPRSGYQREDPLLGCKLSTSHCIHTEEIGELIQALVIKALKKNKSTCRRIPSSDLITSQRSHLVIQAPWGLASTQNLGGHSDWLKTLSQEHVFASHLLIFMSEVTILRKIAESSFHIIACFPKTKYQ